MNKCVVSLELAKQLYEKKIVTDAEVWWCDETYYDNEIRELNLQPNITVRMDKRYKRLYPAPLPCELLEKMPHSILEEGEVWRLIINIEEKELCYENGNGALCMVSDYKNLASGLAELWLKKEGYLKGEA